MCIRRCVPFGRFFSNDQRRKTKCSQLFFHSTSLTSGLEEVVSKGEPQLYVLMQRQAGHAVERQWSWTDGTPFDIIPQYYPSGFAACRKNETVCCTPNVDCLFLGSSFKKQSNNLHGTFYLRYDLTFRYAELYRGFLKSFASARGVERHPLYPQASLPV